MEPGDGIYVERTLPIDGALLSEVLLRLRRDTEGSTIRWTLGNQGAIEIDVNMVSAGNAWTTTARLAGGLALVPATLHLAPIADDAVELKLEAQQPTPEWLVTRHRELAALAHAAIDELAEELLWHAARAGVASQHWAASTRSSAVLTNAARWKRAAATMALLCSGRPQRSPRGGRLRAEPSARDATTCDGCVVRKELQTLSSARRMRAYSLLQHSPRRRPRRHIGARVVTPRERSRHTRRAELFL